MPPTPQGDDVVVLRIPAQSAFLRHVRVLTATVADDAGFDVERIEAIRVAVDELAALAMADVERSAALQIELRTTADDVELRGRCGPVTEAPVLDSIAAQLVANGSDEHSLAVEGDACVFSLRLRRPTEHR